MVKKSHMKGIILFLTFIFILAQTVNAQIKRINPPINWGEYLFFNHTDFDENTSKVSIIVAIHQDNTSYGNADNGSFWNEIMSQALHKSLSKNSLFTLNRPKDFFAITTFDNHRVHFFLQGVNARNANEYEFRVLKNQDVAIVQWTKVSKEGSQDAPINFRQMAYLGSYLSEEGNDILVDVRKKGTTKIIASAVVEWGSARPVLLNIYSANELNEFLNRLSSDTYLVSSKDLISSKESSKWKLHYSVDQLDAKTSLPKKLKVISTDNNLIFYLKAAIHKKNQVEYELTKDQKVIRSWNKNEFDKSFIWLKNLSPGEYLLKIRYTIQRKNVTEYPFVIVTPWYQTVIFKIIISFLIASYLGFVIYLIPVLRQKHKAKEELAKKEKLQLELKAIYAQLNPHFVFNALSSIQGLINKQDIQGANMYLSDFARLMRNSMTNNNKEQTTLKEELITLETYLKLEKLRFGFTYHINVNDINVYETEIPSLLLQPLIENAVKHGVSSLKENGIVDLTFSKTNNDMIVTIQDNGGGFVLNGNVSGYGLKLTNDRIKLLNQIMKEQSVEFHINENSPSGTKVSLTFKNWFL